MWKLNIISLLNKILHIINKTISNNLDKLLNLEIAKIFKKF